MKEDHVIMDPSFLQQLFADSRKLRKGTDTTAYEAFMGFYHAVRWRDPGVMCMLGFHVVYAALCLALRNHPTVHIALFLLTCGLSYSATHINIYLAAHWRKFGFSQNYFDRHGVFLSSLFCAPLLLIAFAQMVRVHMWQQMYSDAPSTSLHNCSTHAAPLPPHSLQLYSLAVSCDLLVKVKRAELKQHLRDKRKAEAEGGGAGEGAGREGEASAPPPPKNEEGKKKD